MTTVQITLENPSNQLAELIDTLALELSARADVDSVTIEER